MMLIDAPRVGALNPSRVSFGRHESFPLRYAWLPKGFRVTQEDPRAFEAADATVRLGVGKNMVHSIRYWLRASRMTDVTTDGLFPTQVGKRLLDREDGWDPYLEDDGSLWLLHWLLAANPEQATAWYWFFNHFHKPEFSSQEAAQALLTFVAEHVVAKYSATKAKQDVAIVLRMYAPSRGGGRVPFEEALDSPLTNLRLATVLGGSRRYQSKPSGQERLPVRILGFAVAELFEFSGASELSVDALMYGGDGLPAPGAVFRLTESALLSKVEDFVSLYPDAFRLQETAGLRQVFCSERVDPLSILEDYYAAPARRETA